MLNKNVVIGCREELQMGGIFVAICQVQKLACLADNLRLAVCISQFNIA